MEKYYKSKKPTVKKYGKEADQMFFKKIHSDLYESQNGSDFPDRFGSNQQVNSNI